MNNSDNPYWRPPNTHQEEIDQDYPQGAASGWMVEGSWYPDTVGGPRHQVERRPPTHDPSIEREGNYGQYPYIPGQPTYPQLPQYNWGPVPWQQFPNQTPQGFAGAMSVASGPALPPGRPLPFARPATSDPALVPRRPVQGPMGTLPVTSGPMMPPGRPFQGPSQRLPITRGPAMRPNRPIQGPMGILPGPNGLRGGMAPQPYGAPMGRGMGPNARGGFQGRPGRGRGPYDGAAGRRR